MRTIPLLPKLLLLLLLTTCLVLPVQAVFSAIANTDKVKLFAEPTPTAAVVEILKKGDVVKVSEKSEDGQFWEVEHKGNHGWIMSHQLSPKDYRY
jgi:SH3-like domain-containing protein